MVHARIQRSPNGGSNCDTISEGTAAHPGGTPDQIIDVPEATLAVSPGRQFRLLRGPSGIFGQVSYQSNPDRNFFRFGWGA